MEKTPITISANELLQGMSDSMFLGVSKIVNLDLHSKKGAILISNDVSVETGSPNTGFVQLHAKDEVNGVDYYADDDGKIFRRTAGATWTRIDNIYSGNSGATSSKGLAVYKDYLFFLYNSGSTVRSDRLGPLSGSPTWSNNWGDFSTSSVSGKICSLSGQDDILYFGINNNVASLTDATSAATINQSALDLPLGYKILSLEELGVNLVIGTLIGNRGDIFTWDRVSPSFDLPTKTVLKGIYGLKNKDNIIYGYGDTFGYVLQTNGTQSQKIKKLSVLTNEPKTPFNLSQSCISEYDDGILFGLGKTAGQDNGVNGLFYLKNGAWQIFTLTPGDGTNNHDLLIGTITNIGNNQWLVSWQYDSTYGFDVLSTSAYTTGYGAYFESQMYNVGTRIQPRTFQSCKFEFTKPLTTGQGIKIEFRLNSEDIWTESDTFAYGDGTGSDRDNLGGITSFDFSPNIPKAEHVQFRISLTTSVNAGTTPELLYVTFE